MFAREIGAVVRTHVRRAGGVSAAVQPHHHRTPAAFRRARRPQVQVQAVFAHRLAQVERRPLGHEDGIDERRSRADRHRVAHAGPRLHACRRQEAPRPGGGGAVRNTFERVHAIVDEAADLSSRRLDDRAGRALRRVRRCTAPLEEERGSRHRARAHERSPIHRILLAGRALIYQCGDWRLGIGDWGLVRSRLSRDHRTELLPVH